MITKLTLTIEEDVIDSAKKYARKKGSSLSNIVENYLKSITSKESKSGEIPPKILRLKGSIKLPSNFDYKKELSNAINKKHIK